MDPSVVLSVTDTTVELIRSFHNCEVGHHGVNRTVESIQAAVANGQVADLPRNLRRHVSGFSGFDLGVLYVRRSRVRSVSRGALAQCYCLTRVGRLRGTEICNPRFTESSRPSANNVGRTPNYVETGSPD
jgi:hypothetical protein